MAWWIGPLMVGFSASLRNCNRPALRSALRRAPKALYNQVTRLGASKRQPRWLTGLLGIRSCGSQIFQEKNKPDRRTSYQYQLDCIVSELHAATRHRYRAKEC
jgi:hypothetical protein